MGNTKIRDDRVNVFLKELANKRRKKISIQAAPGQLRWRG